MGHKHSWQRLLVLALLMAMLVPLGTHASESRVLFAQLPASAWQRVKRADGIRTGGAPGMSVEIQVIVDANCPYCARLYAMFRHQHPDVPVRWVPIDYLLDNSGRLAAAILQSPDPVASLDQNFLHYHNDYRRSHGGYRPPEGKKFVLPKANVDLKQYWIRWGGSTPMIIFTDRKGRVMRASGARQDIVKAVLAHTRAPLREYRKR